MSFDQEYISNNGPKSKAGTLAVENSFVYVKRDGPIQRIVANYWSISVGYHGGWKQYFPRFLANSIVF